LYSIRVKKKTVSGLLLMLLLLGTLALACNVQPVRAGGIFHLFDSPSNRSLFKVAWKPDGSYALLVTRDPHGYGSEIFRFDGNSYALALNDSNIIIQDAAWNPDGSYALFTAHYYANQNHRFKIIKYNGTDFSTIQAGGTDDMRAIAWKPDGSYALIVGGNWAAGIVWKFDGNNLTKVSYPSFWKFMLVDWRPDGSYALIVDFFGDVCKFDGTTLTLLTEVPTTTVNDIGWSADGSYALLTGWFNLEWEEHLVVLKFDGISFIDVTWQTGTTRNLAGISSSVTGGTLIVGGGGTVLKYDGDVFATLTEGVYSGLTDVAWKPNRDCALVVGGKTVLLYVATPKHDIAVTNVMNSKTVVGQGYCVDVAVVVENPGDISESSVVTIYYSSEILTFEQWETFWSNGDVNRDGYIDSADLWAFMYAYYSVCGDPNYNPDCDFDQDCFVGSADAGTLNTGYGWDIWAFFNMQGDSIGRQSVHDLLPAESATLVFTWCMGIPYGSYISSARAGRVTGETDITDNFSNDGWVIVTIPGDIDGDYYVGSEDAGILNGAYGTSEGDPPYVPEADIDSDGYIGSADAGILNGNYGKTAS